jgi:ribonuclease R
MAEGLVHVSSLNDDWYEYRSRQSRLVGRKSKKVYQLGDVVKVKVVKVDILRNQIDLEAYEDELEINTNPIISDNLETKELASSTDNEK